jgi:hypothetical protein
MGFIDNEATEPLPKIDILNHVPKILVAYDA